jgi:RNA polymerase sigma-70 factor (ECF subfamily)
MGSQSNAEDVLQDVWLGIHRVRHTYRPSEPLLPWVYAIARCVRVDNYRWRRRIESHESAGMPKVNGLSLEEVARATSSILGAVKQKAHRAYQGLRNVLEHSHLSTPPRKGVGK